MSMAFFILLGLVLLAGIAIVVLKLNSAKPSDDQKDKLLMMMNENLNSVTKQMMAQLNDMRGQLDRHSNILQKSNQSIGERLDNAARVVTDVKSHLSKLDEANKKIYDVGKDISSLQEILKAPKLRGGLGELSLENLLENLPREMYAFQYAFKNGKKVDAVIHFKDHIVPIDAKFSLENFQKFLAAQDEKEKKTHRKAFMADVKKRIDETAEYIQPDERTLDFALMYIPAENVYYEVIVRDEDHAGLDEYARSKHVIPVSPNNLFAYLKTILIGFRGMQIEKSARQIQMLLGRLKHDFEKFGGDFVVLGSHLSHARNKYEETERSLMRLNEKLTQIELVESAPETPLIT